MIKDTIELESNRHMNRLRCKQSSGKVSDVFSCLTRIEEVKKLSKKDFKAKYHKSSEIERKSLKKDKFTVEYESLCSIPVLTKGQRRRKKKLARRLGLFKPQRKQRDYSNRVPSKYSVYIKSALWNARRNRLFKVKPRMCEICGSPDNINVHHLRYDNSEFGSEKDTDLAVVCRKHHDEFHQIYGVSKDFHKEFEEFKRNILKP